MREPLPTLLGGIEMDAARPPAEPEAFFFGRGAELELLRNTLNVVRTTGQCRAVTLIGSSGLGKSRLLEEFTRDVRILDEPSVRVFVAQTSSARFSPLTELLTRRFKLEEAPDLETAKSSLHDQVANVLDDRKVGDVLYLLGDLLELEFPRSPITKALEDVSADLSARRVILKTLLEADAAFGPMLLVMDDLHLAHDRALSMLRFLLENLNGPVMFLSAARPEILARPDAPIAGDRHDVRHLSPLGDVDTIALIGSALGGGSPLPLYVVEQAREVTGGNPGRIETAARHYRETGTLPPPPERESTLLESRLDALSSEERLLLQKATLLGGVFWLGSLIALERVEKAPPAHWPDDDDADPSRAAVAAALSSLAARDYVIGLPDSTFDGDEEYVFKHRAEREQLAARNNAIDVRPLHRALASWLEGRPETRSHEEYLELMAEQREKAGAPAHASLAYLEAALRARSHASKKRELSCLENAMRLFTDEQRTERLGALLRSGELLFELGKLDAAASHLRAGFDLAYRLDRKDLGRAAARALRTITERLEKETARSG